MGLSHSYYDNARKNIGCCDAAVMDSVSSEGTKRGLSSSCTLLLLLLSSASYRTLFKTTFTFTNAQTLFTLSELTRLILLFQPIIQHPFACTSITLIRWLIYWTTPKRRWALFLVSFILILSCQFVGCSCDKPYTPRSIDLYEL